MGKVWMRSWIDWNFSNPKERYYVFWIYNSRVDLSFNTTDPHNMSNSNEDNMSEITEADQGEEDLDENDTQHHADRGLKIQGWCGIY